MQLLGALPLFPLGVPRSLIRDTLIPVAAFLSVFLLPQHWFLAGFLIVGQAHFAMTFLYQYRGGKVNRRYLLMAGALLLLLVTYFVVEGTFLPIFLVTAVLFATHFAYDEFTLHSEREARWKFPSVIVFALLFFSLILYALFPSFSVAAIIAGTGFCLYVILRILFFRPITISERYIWLVGSLLLILALGFGLRPEILLSLVIILHCINWYVDYGRLVAKRGDPIKHRRYWTETAATLAISVLLYTVYITYHIPFLQIAFLPMYYDAWALAHFGLSLKILEVPRV